MKKLIILSVIAVLASGFCFFAFPGKKKVSSLPKGFALVELFTSEGCSSCPAADEAVIQLAKDYPEHVYILAFHVDYWNYIGWKDEFSSAAFTERQREYGNHFSLGSVYTPQIVVNGRQEFVGSKKSVLATSVKSALEGNPSGEIKLTVSKENASSLRVNYEANTSQPAILNIALVQKNATTAVKRGENKGKSLHHINIVRVLKSTELNKVAKAIIPLPVPADISLDNIEVVAFIQDKKTWNILAATSGKIN